MPKLTKNLNLVKIQGNEYYDGDVENENLDKIDASIDEINTGKVDIDGIDHETLKGRIDSDAQKVKVVENKLNRKDQMLLNPPLTTENPIQSVKDIEAGVASVVVPGLTLVNSIKNGDFSDDTTGWNISNQGSLSVTSKIISAIGDGTSTAIGINQLDFVNVKEGDSVFFYGKCGVLEDGAQSIIAYCRAGGGTITPYFTQSNPAAGDLYDCYKLITIPSGEEGTLDLTFYASYANAENSNGKTLRIDGNEGVFAINMTAIGIEHFTEEQMLALCRNGYFEGMQSRRGSLVKSVNKNLVNILDLLSGKLGLDGLNGHYKWVEYDLDINSSYKFSFDWANEYFTEHTLVAIAIKPDGTQTQFNLIVNGNKQNLPTVDAGRSKIYFGFYNYGGVTGDFLYDISNFMFRKISTSVDYIEHQHSNQQFQPLLGSVPNGERDEVDLMNGVMNVRTNVGRDGVSKTVSGVLTIYANGQGLNNDLSIARIEGYLPDALLGVLKSGYGYDGTNTYKVGTSTLSFSTEHGLIFSTGGRLFILIPTVLLSSDDLAGMQTYLDANPIHLTYQLAEPFQRQIERVNPLATYAGYTQFVSEIGKIGPERATVAEHTAGTRYYYNVIDHPNTGGKDSTLNFRVESFDNIKYRGKSILNICDIESTYSHGDMRFSISNDNVELHNIDPYALDINYTTLETNGYKDVEVKYNVDLASAVSSNSQAISNVGEQVDRNTNTLTNQNLINLEFDVRLTAGGL